MGYYTGSASFGTTGNKTLVLDLGGTPTWVRATMGARANTTETAAIFSQGMSDGTNTNSYAIGPSVSKKWGYTSEPTYLIAGYNSSGTKIFSATLQGSPFGDDELYINVDTANSSYSITFEVGN